jgi:hypothetical protein
VEAIKKLQPPQTRRRNPKDGRYDGTTQLIHIQIKQMWHDFLQAATQGGWFPVGGSGNGSLHRA